MGSSAAKIRSPMPAIPSLLCKAGLYLTCQQVSSALFVHIHELRGDKEAEKHLSDCHCSTKVKRERGKERQRGVSQRSLPSEFNSSSVPVDCSSAAGRV